MFLPKKWSARAWHVRLRELESVFNGFFSTGGRWAEIWAANTPLDVLENPALFMPIYVDTLFGRLDQQVANVRLLLDAEHYDELRVRVKNRRDPIRRNLSVLTPGKRERLLVKRRDESDEVFADVQGIVGFCAVSGTLDPEREPLVFYRLADPAHPSPNERPWVLAAPMKSGCLFSEKWEDVEDVFASTEFVSVADLIGNQRRRKRGPAATETKDEVRLLLVAALSEEIKWICAELPELREVRGDGQRYHEGIVKSKDDTYLYHVFLVRASRMGGVPAATASMAGMMEFDPDYLMLLGIAGGRKDKVKRLGNVVYGLSYEAYEYAKRVAGKDGKDKNVPRPRQFSAGDQLVRMVTEVDMNEDWVAVVKACDGQRRTVRAVRGHVLTGCKVVATARLLETSKESQDEVAALEMEAEGVWCASSWKNKQFIVIKGVSDFADEEKGGKRDKINREFATRASARFLRSALEEGHLQPP